MHDNAHDQDQANVPRVPRGMFQVGAGGRMIWLFEIEPVARILESRHSVSGDRLARQLRGEAEATMRRRLGCKAIRFAAAPNDRPVLDGAVVEARARHEAIA
jgi:hypothetical protein